MKDQLLRLLDYEHWANQLVINALDEVDNPPVRAIEVMNHILAAQQVWLGRLTNSAAYVPLWEIASIPYMAVAAERNYQRLRSHISSLTEEQLNQIIEYKNINGDPFASPLLDVLTHLSHHAAYHRGQVIHAIRSLLTEIPKTDYILWAREV